MTFVYIHLVYFGGWIAVNLGWVPFLPPFDPTFVILAMLGGGDLSLHVRADQRLLTNVRCDGSSRRNNVHGVGRHDVGRGGIEHAELRVGETMMEVSEAHGQWGPTRGGFHLFVTDCDAVYHEALAAGATALYPPEDKPYGERSAGVTDRWGNQWYIATPVRKRK